MKTIVVCLNRRLLPLEEVAYVIAATALGFETAPEPLLPNGDVNPDADLLEDALRYWDAVLHLGWHDNLSLRGPTGQKADPDDDDLYLSAADLLAWNQQSVHAKGFHLQFEFADPSGPPPNGHDQGDGRTALNLDEGKDRLTWWEREHDILTLAENIGAHIYALEKTQPSNSRIAREISSRIAGIERQKRPMKPRSTPSADTVRGRLTGWRFRPGRS